MPDLESQIFSVALTLFLLMGAAKLVIEQLVSLLIQYKKLEAMSKADYSLESGKLEMRSPSDCGGLSRRTISGRCPYSFHARDSVDGAASTN
jgi:hypothetical protein